MGEWGRVGLLVGLPSQSGRRGGLGGAVPGFQWGEEKPASFPTTQHPRSDHCGGFPTCCAVQATGTRHTTWTPRGLQTRLRISLPLPQSIHKPPPPTHPHIHHLHRQQNYRTSSRYGFLHQNIPPCLNIRQTAEFGCPERSSPRGKGGYLRQENSPT